MEKADILKYLDKLPGFPATLTKILQLSNDPSSSSKDLIHAISLDPAMTARVLRLINSAYFGVTSQVVSINRAVVMLGINTIKNVAISSSVIRSMRLPDNFRWFKSDQFWEHNLGVAVGAKLIAERVAVPVQEREEFFIAGLLHDIGKVLFIQRMPEEFARTMDPAYEPEMNRIDLEKRDLGVSHPELGGLMAEKWLLPIVLREAILEHHAPRLGNEEFDKVKSAVHLSNVYCNKHGIGIQKLIGVEDAKEEVLDYLSLKHHNLDDIFISMREKIEEAKVFLKQ